jgi:hypothetical protein
MRYVILLLIGLTVETLPAFADDSDDWPVCNTFEGNSAIAACTRILQRWEASGSDLSTAFEVGLLSRKVHDSVWNATHEQQEPFTYGVLPAEALYFKTAGN